MKYVTMPLSKLKGWSSTCETYRGFIRRSFGDRVTLNPETLKKGFRFAKRYSYDPLRVVQIIFDWPGFDEIQRSWTKAENKTREPYDKKLKDLREQMVAIERERAAAVNEIMKEQRSEEAVIQFILKRLEKKPKKK